MKSWIRLAAHSLRQVVRIPLADLAILAEAGLLVALAKLAVATVPFRLLLRRFGRPGEPQGSSNPAPESGAVARVRWAVRVVAARSPGSLPCLPQALAARLMLARRGVPTTLHLGVRRLPSEALSAHAWLCAGPTVVTGKAGHRFFAEVARFA